MTKGLSIGNVRLGLEPDAAAPPVGPETPFRMAGVKTAQLENVRKSTLAGRRSRANGLTA